MENKEMISIIDRVLGLLNQLPIVGLQNAGKLWNATSELERLRYMIGMSAEEREGAAGSEETEGVDE